MNGISKEMFCVLWVVVAALAAVIFYIYSGRRPK